MGISTGETALRGLLNAGNFYVKSLFLDRLFGIETFADLNCALGLLDVFNNSIWS